MLNLRFEPLIKKNYKDTLTHKHRLINHFQEFDWDRHPLTVVNVVNNIVGVAKFEFKIDLKFFHKVMPQSKLELQKIPCLRLTLKRFFKDFNAVALIYHSGKVVITGFNQLLMVHKAIAIMSCLFTKYGLRSRKLPQFIPNNIVSSIQIQAFLPLNKIGELKGFTFDSEEFPAAKCTLRIVRPLLSNATIFFFAKGKIVITGARSIGESHIVAQYIAEVVLPKVMKPLFSINGFQIIQ